MVLSELGGRQARKWHLLACRTRTVPPYCTAPLHPNAPCMSCTCVVHRMRHCPHRSRAQLGSVKMTSMAANHSAAIERRSIGIRGWIPVSTRIAGASTRIAGAPTRNPGASTRIPRASTAIRITGASTRIPEYFAHRRGHPCAMDFIVYAFRVYRKV